MENTQRKMEETQRKLDQLTHVQFVLNPITKKSTMISYNLEVDDYETEVALQKMIGKEGECNHEEVDKILDRYYEILYKNQPLELE